MPLVERVNPYKPTTRQIRWQRSSFSSPYKWPLTVMLLLCVINSISGSSEFASITASSTGWKRDQGRKHCPVMVNSRMEIHTVYIHRLTATGISVQHLGSMQLSMHLTSPRDNSEGQRAWTYDISISRFSWILTRDCSFRSFVNPTQKAFEVLSRMGVCRQSIDSNQIGCFSLKSGNIIPRLWISKYSWYHFWDYISLNNTLTRFNKMLPNDATTVDLVICTDRG